MERRESANGENDPSRTLFPISSNSFSRLGRFFSSLSPFELNSRDRRTLHIQARRFLQHNNEEPSLPMPRSRQSIILERQRILNILGHWSADDIQLQEQTAQPVVPRTGSLGNLTNSPQRANWLRQDVAIDVETENSRGERLRQVLHGNQNDENPTQNEEGENGPTSSEDANQENGEGGEEESLESILERYPEARELLKIVWQHCIFLLIILAKNIFDRFLSLVVVASFWLTFTMSNYIVKKIIAQPERISVMSALMLSAIYIVIPLGTYIYYVREPHNLYYSVLLLPLDYKLSTLGDLIWIVVITDFVIKLATVLIKGIYASIPCVFTHHTQRGKHLALVEISSQLYRSLAPIQPWLSYLFDSYTGVHKVIGVCLAGVYMLCKLSDVIERFKNFYYIFKKFMQDTTYGITPTKAQLKEIGTKCPICHDEFVTPTMLQCRHIFCEQCVSRWFDRERTCPMCRLKVADDPKYKDGGTSHFIQLF